MSNKLPVEEHYKKYLKLYRELYPNDYYLEDDDIIQEMNIKMYKNEQRGNARTLCMREHLKSIHDRYDNNFIDKCESLNNVYNESYVDSFKELNRQMIVKGILEACETLLPLERLVIIVIYGLYDGKYKTLEEASDIFKNEYDWDVTRERIRQVRCKAERKLKHPIRNKVITKWEVE